MNSVTIIIIGGIYNLAFALFHLMFWGLFRWKEDLTSLSRINRAIVQVMNLCLIFVFLAFGYISLFHTTELLSTSLGNTLLVLIFIFWILRAIEQIVFFGLRKKISVILFIVCVFGAFFYLLPVLDG
jgi:hypothetical protein